MKKLYNNILYLRALMLVFMAGLFVFSANAQDFTVAQTFNSTYLGERDTVLIDTSATFFSTDTRYYLYRDNDFSTTYTDGDDILDTSSSIGDTTLTYVWDESGLTAANYRVAAITGFGTNETTDITDVTITGVPSNDAETRTNGVAYGSLTFPFATDDYYAFDNVGFRGLETGVIPELDVDNSVTASLNFDFYLTDIPENSDDSVVLEYSLDGSTWITLIDSLNNGYDDPGETSNRLISVSYELPNMAKDPNTRFRFRQGPTSASAQRSDYTEGEAAWYIDPDNFQVVVGNQDAIHDEFVVNYSIIRPFTGITLTDTTGNQNYYGGGGFEIDATFTGYEDQVSDFSYVAIFRNTTTGQTFSVVNTDMTFGETENNPSEFVYDFEIDGVIPTDIDYSDNTSYDDWDVSVEAFTGATATVGNSENLLAAGTVVGGTNVTNFNADDDRFYLSDELDVQTVTGASITLDLNKNLAQLYPSGTEVVLEYTTNGTDFTELIADGRTAAAISLNDTIDGGFDPFTYDISSETGLISTTTQFRVRQLSNSGLNLDTWGIGQLSLSTEGSLLEDNSTISYGSVVGVTINPPVIVLDPVDVPAEFIYPGDEVDLTYNITLGEFPAGTTFTAMLEGGTFDYAIGTSSLITPGDDQDHTITVTIPPIIGGDYSVKLETNPESNSVTIPIFNTELEITGVSSDNGIFDGATDVFYPGDNITATYEITGSVGTGAELFFEVWDQGDNSTTDDDEWVVLTSATGADIDGTITGTLPTGINFDDPSNAKVRIRIGNGSLANSSSVFLQDLNGDNVAYFVSTSPGFGYIFNAIDEELIEGNDPTDIDAFIGSGERSATTIPFEMPFGGGFYVQLDGISHDFDQDVLIQVSNDGTTWETLETLEYTGTGTFDSEFFLYVPESSWGDEVRFRVIYNEAGSAGEFENEIELDYLYVVANESVSANSDEFDISGQLRRYTVSLEVLSETSFVVGEEVTVEYTTEGPFPANTGFALLFEGNLDGDGDPGTTGDANSGEDFFTVLATSTDEGSGSFTFNVPDMAYEFDGTDAIFTLYSTMTVVAYDATGGADFLPNETITVNEDDQFLVIEGTDDDSGNYTFDLAGNRDLLTDAFDLSGAQSVILNFNYTSTIDEDDQLSTIPVLQYSIDAGATFVNIEVEESGLEGGYIVGTNTYAVEIPTAAVTAATHFRWVQNLNLGAGTDTWTVNGISVELVNGNEIDSDYKIVNDDQAISVSHPNIAGGQYSFGQVDPSAAVFNGEDVQLSFAPVFETSDEFPAAATFTYYLKDDMGDFVVDPSNGDAIVLGTATAPGDFTASIPFFVENGTYTVSLVSEKDGAEEPYYYFGSETTAEDLGTIEVFLRVLRTTLTFDENDVLYAGSQATFAIELENSESDNTTDLFATLLVVGYSTDGDLVLANQQGIADMTVDLPPYLRGQSFNFEVRLTENAVLGEPGDIIGSEELLSLELEDDSFVSDELLPLEISTRVYTESELGYNSNEAIFFTWDYDTKDGVVRLQQNINGGGWSTIATYSGINSFSTGWTVDAALRDFSGNDQIQIRWIIEGATQPGAFVNVSNVYWRDVTVDDSELSVDDGVMIFENDFGRGLITSREVEAGELSSSARLEFNLTFEKLAEEIASNQFLIFEYSTDGGATYSELETFPEVDEEDNTLDDELFIYTLTDFMDVDIDNVKFRFRQEERNNIFVSIRNFSFYPAEVLPFDYQSDSRMVANQALLVTSIGAEQSCLVDEIVLGYEVRGSFGADNIVTVSYDQINGAADGTLTQEFDGIVSGTGTLDGFTLPSTVFGTGDNNKNFRFRLNYDDDTYMDIDEDYDDSGQPLSENSVEVVAKIDLDAEISVSSGDKACEGESLIVNVDDVQNYFTYEIIDTSDDSVLGTLTYDPEMGDTEVDLGPITADVVLGLQITSNTSSGTACRTLTSTFELEVELVENGLSFLYNDNLDLYEVVSTGQTVDLCEGASIDLEVARDADEADAGGFTATLVEWFRDDINTPIATGNSIDEDDINNKSGDYFARITDGECQYLTEAISVNIVVSPDKPVITVTSGNLTGCEGDDPVVMEGPTGFAFYQWSFTPTSGSPQTFTTRVIEAEDQGTYTIDVSNFPFNGTTSGCESSTSDPVYLERYNLSEFLIGTTGNLQSDASAIVDGDVFEGCGDSFVVYFYDGFNNTQTANNGTIEIIKDGVSEGFTTSNNYDLAPLGSGVYSFNWINHNVPLGTACTASSVSFTLNISDIPDPVVISTTDALAFCEGGGSVTLTAPAGFAQYRWRNFGSVIGNNSDGFGNASNTLTVTDAGEYTVEVSNQAAGTACFSGESNTIEVNVRQIAGDDVNFDPQGTLCGPGTASIEITGSDDQWSYQIYDQVTNTAVGAPFIGSPGNSIFVDLDITEQTSFYVLVSYSDGEGCPELEASSGNFFTVSLYNVELELDGNTIRAEASGGIFWTDIEWFRNGVRLQQRSGDSQIFVTDAAEYSAEVTFNNGECVITTNTIAVEGARIQTFFGELEASTYPNPSSDFINVDMKGGDLGSYDVKVANLSGQVMLSEEFNKTEEEDSMTVDIRSIEKGIYTLIIRKGSKVQSFRIVKQ
ncbi:T9SS type A sorting domain-containing protein [Ekhidna sp.]|uniref:T9SS type A sorting domain-containing protein n=1 Tax=Ekhidna sp. TaxID=2608089 RepID=UPI003B512402